VRARTPLFQSGDAPSRGPHRSHESTEQTTSTFIHQYVIYTLAGLAGPWMRRYALGWKATNGLDMQKGGRDVLRYIQWRDGYLADDYKYEAIGRGTRLSISYELLRTIL
jgi:hypothetical protein